MVYFPVEYKRINNAEREFDGHPEVIATCVPSRGHLDKGFDDSRALEIGGYYIVLLIGTKEGLTVIDEVTDKRGCEKSEVGEIDDAQLEHCVREDERKEGTKHETGAENDESDPAIKIAENRNDLVDFPFVMLEEGLIEHITNSAADAQLGQVEEAKQVLQRGGQAHEVRSQCVQEYLSRKERQS